ncbi:MAG: hypothetical protein WCL06_11840 [Bacteroidota bacterium]
MNLLKTLLSCFLISSALWASGQANISKSNIAMDRGINMYEQKNYKEAEAQLLKSVGLYPQFRSYYYLAKTYFAIKDTCRACDNFLKANTDGDKKVKAEYDSLCFKHFRINYLPDSNDVCLYYTDFITDRCTHKTHQEMYRNDTAMDDVAVFRVIGYDSLTTSAPDFMRKHAHLKEIGSNKVVFTEVSTMPKYPGGEFRLAKLIYNNAKMPRTVNYKKKNNTLVIVKIMVDKDGSYSDISVVDAFEGIDRGEIVKALQLMDDWEPGMIGKTPVRVEVTMPIRVSMVFDLIIMISK